MNPNLPPHTFAEQSPNPYAPKNPGGGTNWRTVGLLLGSILLVSIAVCSGVAYLGVRGISNRPPTAAEKQALVTASDLKSFGAMPQKLGQREVWNVKKNIDGSEEIEYDYDPDRAPGGDENLFVTSSVELAPSESSARESYSLMKGAFELGLGVGGVKAEDLPASISGVDQSHVALLRASTGAPVGNMVIVRQGKRVHGLLLVGIYFEGADELNTLLQPKIAASATIEK